MSFNITKSFNILFKNFLEISSEVVALIVSDRGGLIVAGETSSDVNMEIISVLTAIVNPILDRIRNEFAFKKFGTASFDTDEYRLLFISVDENITLSVVLTTLASVDKVSPYAYFLAEKTAQIVNAEEGDVIQLEIPNFEYEGETVERIKDQIYQLRLESGGTYRFKFIIIGDHYVGKTSIVRRYVDRRFSKDYRATIGINIITHSFDFFENEINLSLWDIGAQQYFKRFRRTYYMGSQAAFIVFDLTNRESFENVKIWFDELINFLGKMDLPIVIVGNKTDLKEKREISYEEGVSLVPELAEKGVSKISYIETSALTGENINDAFSLISYHYIVKSKEKEEELLRKSLEDGINCILRDREKLTLTFITEKAFWNPGLQIMSELIELGKYVKIKDTKEEKIFEYPNGLILKSHLTNNFDLSDSDGAFCIFDARGKEHIDPKWKEKLIEIIESIQENKVVLIGVRVDPEKMDWSVLMEEFDVNEQLERKMVSLLFFKIGIEYRLEIYDQLEVMLNTIKTIR
ncbi:MAG: GTP-binding protein [Promethearchaeota archaeon]|nr:MAG: GTP-binding protein [Candidatus Lokiarchaeota archaeon]